jgi:hypothetical protein
LQPAIEDILAYTDGLKQRLLRQTKEIRHALAPVATNGHAHVKPPTSTVLGNDTDIVASNGVDCTSTTPATCSTQCQATPSRRPSRDWCMRQSRSQRTRRQSAAPAGSVRRAGVASSSEATDPYMANGIRTTAFPGECFSVQQNVASVLTRLSAHRTQGVNLCTSYRVAVAPSIFQSKLALPCIWPRSWRTSSWGVYTL